MLAINVADPRPDGRKLADHIAYQIGAGELLPGDRLPSTSELRSAWGVSSETVRSAVERLKAKGLVISRRGVGVFVAHWHPVTFEPDETPDAVAEAVLDVDTGPPSEAAAAALEIPEDALVVVVTAIDTLPDGRVVRRTVTTYPHVVAVAADASTSDDPEDAAVRLAQAAAGCDVVEVFRSRTATSAESSDLDLPDGVPVLAAESTVTNADGLPVAYSSTTHHGPMSRVVRRR